MVICDLKENTNEKGKYDGVPALVLEILSEGTRKKDITKKFDLYSSTGVKEYWIVNPLNKEVQVFHFDEGEIIENITFKGKETAGSFIFEGFGIPVEKVFV